MSKFAKGAVICALYLVACSSQPARANDSDEAQKSIAMSIRNTLRTEYMMNHRVINCPNTIQCEDALGIRFQDGIFVKVSLLVDSDELIQWQILVYKQSSSGLLAAIYNFYKASPGCYSPGAAI